MKVLGHMVKDVRPDSKSKKAVELEKHLRGLGLDRRYEEEQWYEARLKWKRSQRLEATR